jgi:hypothetical protein
MAHDKILFERNHVFVKERLPPTETRTASFDEINGTMTIIENEHGKFFRFTPSGLGDAGTDDWALVNGGHSIISYKPTRDDADSVSVSSKP